MSEVVLLYTTWPDAESAEAAGRAAVEAGVCACVNVLAPMISIYRWESAVERATETPMIVKTTLEAAAGARELLNALHPYDLPAVVALPVSAEGSSAPFLQWIVDGSGVQHR